METTTQSDDRELLRSYWAVSGAGVVLSVGVGVTWGPAWAVGALVGALIATANLYVLARSVSGLLAGQSRPWGIVVALKFVVLLALTFVLLGSGWVSPLALALGFAALPLGIVIATLLPPRSDSLHQKTDHA